MYGGVDFNSGCDTAGAPECGGSIDRPIATGFDPPSSPSVSRTMDATSFPSRSARRITVPPSSTTTALTVRSVRSRPSRCIRLLAELPMDLASLERARRGAFGPEHGSIRLLEQRAKAPLVGSGEHDEARALRWRERAVVDVVAVQRHQSTAQLPREPVVFDVAGPTQVVVLEHEEDVPLEPG